MRVSSQCASTHRRSGRRVRGLVALAVLAAAHQAGFGQAQRTVVAVQSTVTATDNGNGAPKGFEREDLLLSIRPGVQYTRRGAGLAVRADLSADFVAAAQGTRPDRILPHARLDAQGVVVDRLLFVDADVDVRQVESDPFGVRVDPGSARNARTAGTYRVSPRLEYETVSGLTMLARYDASRTRYAGSVEGDVDTKGATVRLGIRPQPMGAALEWTREQNDYADAGQTDLELERLSLTATIAIGGEWLLGVSGGSERSEFAGTSQTDDVYGLRAYWNPSPRTEVTAAVDRRFFGTGWNLSARHRTPRMSIALRSLREPSSAGNGLGSGDGLAGFLDAILTTRNPDATQRAELVDGLIAGRGLRGTAATGSATTGAYAQLRTNQQLTWVYLGTRTTLSLSAFKQELRQLTRDDGTTFAPGIAVEDSRQHGASMEWNRQLDAQLSLGLGAEWSRITGLGVRLGETTREGTLRANVTRSLSPRTTLSLGLRVRRVSSNASSVNAFDETAGFVGLGHRF